MPVKGLGALSQGTSPLARAYAIMAYVEALEKGGSQHPDVFFGVSQAVELRLGTFQLGRKVNAFHDF